MKRGILPILILGISVLLFFSTPFSIKPASGVNINYTEYWFYISEPTELNFSKMYFQVQNTESYSVRIDCTTETVLGLNVSIDLEWSSSIFESGETRTNRYKIKVNEIFNRSYAIRIFCTVYSLTGSNLGTGAIVVNRLTYYSNLEGYYLDIQTVDQSSEPRHCSINMMYKKNASMNWSPIKEWNGTRYNGYLPRGLYHIVATDIETSEFAQTVFELWKDTNVTLELELVGFNRFKFVEHNETGQMGVNCTINNYVGILEEVTIFANLYENESYKTKTSVEYRSEFPKTVNYEMTLWFSPIVWKNNTQYRVQGVIYSHQTLIAYENREFYIFIKGNSKKTNPSPSNPVISPDIILALGLSGTVIAGVFGFNYYKIWRTKRELSKMVSK